MHSKYFLSCVITLLAFSAFSQIPVTGSIYDEKGEPIPGATVRALNKDSVLAGAVMTNASGEYSLSLAPGTKYTLVFTYFGFSGKSQALAIETKNESLQVKKITLKENALNLKEVEIKAMQIRGEQKGDSTIFKADSFKTNPDATAEELIKKMPGVVSDNSGVKVNGEAVQKVLVDGKPFFGDDANAALKNLPAEIIDRVEIFDKMSDQSQFTGFNDGEQQKTINLVTKKNKNKGWFGRVQGGYGADEDLNGRYNAGAAINSFNDKRRVSLLLLSNNINQQNFSVSDITGASGSSGPQRSGGGGRQSNSSPLMTTPQNGNTTTNSAGLNFSDVWGKKMTVSGSYFVNHSDNKNHSDISRNYFTEDKLAYTQTNDDGNVNLNHRFNVRVEYSLDSANKLILTPAFTYQDNISKSALSAKNTVSDGELLSNTITKSENNNKGYDLSIPLLYQHKFKKDKRTLSLNLTPQQSERMSAGSYNSQNSYADTSFLNLDQVFSTYSNSKKVSANLAFTEPLSKNAQLQIAYNPSYSESKSNKKTEDYNGLTNEYDDFNSGLSNKYSNIYQVQRGGLTYRYQKNKLNISFGADAQESRLTGNQEFPLQVDIDQSFQNILPNAQLNFRFKESGNLRVNYRTSTNIPSVQQLQSVMDVSNPLQVKTGNPDLKQTFENNLNVRIGRYSAKTQRNIMLFINGSYSNNYISNSTQILTTDSVIQGFVLKTGSQLTRPVNLDGNYSTRAYFVYGFPLTVIKSNLNFNAGLNYGHSPSFINGRLNYSNSYAANGGLFAGSNISEKVDFSIGYNCNYTVVKNSLQTQSDNSYFSHNATFKLNWIFFKGFVFNSDITQTLFNGLTQSFNQNYFLWNGSLGYKFLKNKSLEAKISVFDILNQNRSIGRTVTSAYTEDYNTLVLRRYALFTLTYTLRNFKSGGPPAAEEKPDNPPGRIPGMRRQEGQ